MNACTRHRRRTQAALVILALVSTFGAACSTEDDSGSPEPSPPAVTSTPEPTVDPSVADAEQQARAAYAGYLQTWALASQEANPDHPELGRYVADPLLSRTRHNIRKLKGLGAVQVGVQTATVQRVEVNLDAKPPVVTIYSCLDYSQIKLVYKSNRSPVPDGAPRTPQVSAVSKAALYTDGRWLVNEAKQGTASC